MAKIIVTKGDSNAVSISQQRNSPVTVRATSKGGTVTLTPTVEVNENVVIFHYVTLAQMEKMLISITDLSDIHFILTENEDTFELRFSNNYTQEIAGQLILDDSIELIDFVFGSITVNLPFAYKVRSVYIEGVDANLLEADINWRLADLQKRIGEGGEDPNSLALAQFFGVTLLEGYEFMQDTEVCGELEDIMQLVDPDLTAEQAAAITAQTLNPSES